MQNYFEYPLQLLILFYGCEQSKINCFVEMVRVSKYSGIVAECHLSLKIDSNLYHQLISGNDFNARLELANCQTQFSPEVEYPIELTVSLRPDLIAPILENCDRFKEFFLELDAKHPLLSTDSWFLLEAKQLIPSGEEISYRTFWSYADPTLLFSENPSTDELADRLVEFFQDWAKHNLPNLTQTAIAEAVQELSQELNTDADDLSNMTQEAIASIFSEMVDSFQRWTQGESLDTLTPAPPQPLMPIVQGFFDQDGWDCKLDNPSTLRLLAQGKTDKWTCYAQIVAQHQFLFYSICPIAIPKPKRSKLAEFITRANYGMTIGNFELDYTDGEIRYKTSIDVEGESLTSALIKRLVYTNVAMMDEYLPAILAMVEDGLSAEAAIQSTEAKVLD